MDERDVERVARSAAESVYGVAALVGPGWLERLAARLNIGRRGVSVSLVPHLEIALDIQLAPGVPYRQVAANVAEKVRYVVQRELATPIAELVVRVDGRVVEPADPPGRAGHRPVSAGRPGQ